jgi:hypothetical protein
MEPITLWAADSGEVRIVHRCSGCGVLKPNRIAGDDSATALATIQETISQLEFGDGSVYE